MVEEPAWKAGGGSLAACGFEPHGFRLGGHGPTGRRWFRKPEIRVRLPVTPLDTSGPVVQRPRRLAYTQETMVQLRPGPLRLGRQPADHLGLEPGMLWVRLPQGTLNVMIGDRLVVGFLALNQATEVRALLPELVMIEHVSGRKPIAGSSNGKMRRSERLHVGSIPASAA